MSVAQGWTCLDDELQPPKWRPVFHFLSPFLCTNTHGYITNTYRHTHRHTLWPGRPHNNRKWQAGGRKCGSVVDAPINKNPLWDLSLSLSRSIMEVLPTRSLLFFLPSSFLHSPRLPSTSFSYFKAGFCLMEIWKLTHICPCAFMLHPRNRRGKTFRYLDRD